MGMRRRAIVTAVAVAAVVAPSAIAPAIGQAAAYRYWSYWIGTEQGWSFANVGPAFRVPADGTLEGWRFSVSGVEGNHSPTFTADFAAVCADTPDTDGRKRVAVVVDPGVPAHAPDGEQPPGAWAMCVTAEPRATGYDVLRAATTVRAERGLICGIGGYPARGCADITSDPAPTRPPSPSPTPTKSSTAPTSSPTTAAAAPTTPSATPTPNAADPAASRVAQSGAAEAASESRDASPRPRLTEASDTDAEPPAEPSVDPSPAPTYSLLTSPLEEPPSGGGSGGALVTGIAVAGIAGLGGAAILRMRRTG